MTGGWQASAWPEIAPARDVTGLRYGWIATCPEPGCGWFEVREDTAGTRLLLVNLLDAHTEDEHPTD